jgi:hypothetical protein
MSRWTSARAAAGLRSAFLLFALVMGSFAGARPVQGQALSMVAGGLGGLVAGGWTTIGTFVARARLGNFVFDAENVAQVRFETMPVFLFPIAGALLGRTPERLRTVGAGAGLGFVGGGAIGIAIGAIVSNTPEAKWAGGIIGSAAGLLLGAAIGGFAANPENSPPTGSSGVPGPSLSVPLGGGG